MLEIGTSPPTAVCIFVADARLARPSHARPITGADTPARVCRRCTAPVPRPCASIQSVRVITRRYNAASNANTRSRASNRSCATHVAAPPYRRPQCGVAMAQTPRKTPDSTAKASRRPRVPRWPREGARFAAVLAERRIGKTEFAEKLGRRYHTIHRWTRGFEFGPEHQSEAAAALSLAADAFVVPMSASERRARETRAVLERFAARCPIAQSLTPAQWLVLRSVRFCADEVRPSVALYEAWSFALKGAIRNDEEMRVADENEAIDETLAHKPPLRRQ